MSNNKWLLQCGQKAVERLSSAAWQLATGNWQLAFASGGRSRRRVKSGDVRVEGRGSWQFISTLKPFYTNKLQPE